MAKIAAQNKLDISKSAINKNSVVVIDFGAQYAQLITRRVREAQIFSILLPYTYSLEKILQYKPQAIILTGGPSTVSQNNAPKIPNGLLDAGIPIFAICYGFQEIANSSGGAAGLAKKGEYGLVEAKLNEKAIKNPLFKNVAKNSQVWMSHKVVVKKLPPDYIHFASSKETPIAAFGNPKKKIYGVQWHPEVSHTKYGQKILENFLYKIANITPNWTTDYIISEKISQIKSQIKNKQAICGLSGGVDSAVAAALVNKAIGKNLICVFVNHGLLRLNEGTQVKKDFESSQNFKLKIVDDRKIFLKKLKGIKDPEQKRKIIGEQFIRSFEKAVKSLSCQPEFLVQGTLYPDIVESGKGENTANIKSHHNVGGLPDDLNFDLIEPLKDLFKDEVRSIGKALGLPDKIINRQPFPGPGLAVRIIGEVNQKNLNILQKADAVAQQVLKKYNKQIWQCPVVLLAEVKTVGVKGDSRHYGLPIVLRPVMSQDAMTADWVYLPKSVLTNLSNRITNEVPEITRVILDITQKPPGTIEWE